MLEKISIILLLNIVFYAKTITYKYCSDDYTVFKNPYPFKNKIHRIWLQLIGTNRVSPQEDHLLTILYHALVCVFIYLAFGHNTISFLAAILFSVNPATNQGSVWIAGRGYVLSTLFTLMSMAFPFAGIIFMYCAAYFNIGFFGLIILPFFIWWLGIFVPIAWILRLKRFKSHVKSKIETEMVEENKKIHPKKIIFFVKTAGFYFIHSLIPIKNTFYHSFMQSAHGNEIMKKRAYGLDRFFWIGVVLITTCVYYFISVPWGMIHFSILWWWIFMFPFLNLFSMSQEISERYMYAPSAALMYILASVIVNNPILISGFFMMYATKMWFYMDSFTDDYWLSEAACLNSPDSWFAWHIRALKRWDTRSFHEAVLLWVMAKIISPKEFKILMNIATALKCMRKDKEAEEYIKMAEENIPLGMEKQLKEVIERARNGEVTICT